MTHDHIPRAAITGAATGVLFMGFFGTLWASIGIGGLQGLGLYWLLIPSLLIGSLFISGGVQLIKASRAVSSTMTDTDNRYMKRTMKRFGMIFGLEGAMIGIASGLCGATDHMDVLFPVMAFIVGAHFFPLAHLFRIRIHYWAGTLMCVLAGITLLTMPARGTWGQHRIVIWWVSVGFGSALILWATGAAIWLMGRRLLARARKTA